MSSMQKVIKYLAIILAISLIIGIFTGIYQGIGALFGVLTDDTSENDFNINEFPNSFSILNVDIKASKLKIVTGESFKVESNNKYVTSKQTNNKLSVIEKHTNFFKLNKNSEVIIYIPEDMIFDKVYISSGAGTINIESITAKDLELELGAGKIEIDNITTYNSTDIDGGAGEVIINNANISNLDLDAGVGKFTLNASIKGKSDIDAGVGELNINLLDSKENYSIYTESGIGRIIVDGNTIKNQSYYGNGNNTIDIDGGIGSININFNN